GNPHSDARPEEEGALWEELGRGMECLRRVLRRAVPLDWTSLRERERLGPNAQQGAAGNQAAVLLEVALEDLEAPTLAHPSDRGAQGALRQGPDEVGREPERGVLGVPRLFHQRRRQGRHGAAVEQVG